MRSALLLLLLISFKLAWRRERWGKCRRKWGKIDKRVRANEEKRKERYLEMLERQRERDIVVEGGKEGK